MANTDKKNFRYPAPEWLAAQSKAKVMRDEGYDIDMTMLIAAAVDLFRTETIAQTAKRLGLQKGKEPAPLYRRPVARNAQ